MNIQLLAFFAENTEDLSWIEKMFGGPVPAWALWAGVGLVVLLIIIFIAVGFFKEINKK